MRTAVWTGLTKILPSPMLPVLAAPAITSATLSTRLSGTTTSILIFGRKSTVYSPPRYSSVCPFCLPKPRTSVTVMPITPMPVRASFTSSSLNGLMMASTFFISDLLENRDRQCRHVGADALEVRQDVQVDLRRLDRLGQAGAQPSQVGFAQIALALPHQRALVQHLLREATVVGREGGDGALEVLRHHAVELLDLGPAGVGESTGLVELLATELHQVLVDDVPDVLEVADHRDQPDLLAAEVRAHRVTPQAREEELDLALEEIGLVVAPLDVLEQFVVAAGEDHRHVAQHPLHHIGHAQGLARGLAQRQRGLVERALVQVPRAKRAVALLVVGHDRLDRPRGQRRERQEQEADLDVEERVRVRDLTGWIARGAGHQV